MEPGRRLPISYVRLNLKTPASKIHFGFETQVKTLHHVAWQLRERIKSISAEFDSGYSVFKLFNYATKYH